MNGLSWLVTYPFRRLLLELRYRRTIKKYQCNPLWEIVKVPIQIEYTLKKAFL